MPNPYANSSQIQSPSVSPLTSQLPPVCFQEPATELSDQLTPTSPMSLKTHLQTILQAAIDNHLQKQELSPWPDVPAEMLQQTLDAAEPVLSFMQRYFELVAVVNANYRFGGDEVYYELTLTNGHKICTALPKGQ